MVAVDPLFADSVGGGPADCIASQILAQLQVRDFGIDGSELFLQVHTEQVEAGRHLELVGLNHFPTFACFLRFGSV